MRLRLIGIFVLVLAAAASAAAHFGYFTTPPVPEVRSAALTRGDILQSVTATGTLQAMRAVDVGSQVTGIVKKLYVDYNSIVKAGELIATIDPSTYQAQLDSANAALDRAKIALAQQELTLEADRRDLAREEALAAHDVAAQTDREAAQLTVKEDEALVKGDQASITLAADAIQQAQVDLGYCTIRSPIDGVVVTRNADEGQTVTASLSVPSLFILATDIKQLELLALVDEADIGKLHPGQAVTFTVDAYPGRQFRATMDHVRLNAAVVNNVVTYQAVAAVSNPDLRLLPSMTSTVKVKIAEARDVVRVPNTALRFQPMPDAFKAFGQTPPPALPAASTASTSADPTKASGGPATNPSDGQAMIDHFFAVLPRQSSKGGVWVLENHQLKRVPLNLGITDGTWTELVNGGLQVGDEVLTGLTVPSRK